MQHMKWPGRNELQKAIKGRFALHSQSIQQEDGRPFHNLVIWILCEYIKQRQAKKGSAC